MAKTGKIDASSALGMFTAIVSWLTSDPDTPGRDWTFVHDYRLDEEPLERVVIHNVGISGQEDVYIGLSNEIHSDSVTAGMVCKVYRYFDPDIHDFFDTDLGNADGSGSTKSFMPYWNSDVSYWIWANSQRIIMVVKTIDKYACAYLGMIDRFMPPSEYQYPLVCFADSCWSVGWGTYISHNELWSLRGDLAGEHSREEDGNRRGNLANVYSWGYSNSLACHRVCFPNGVWMYKWRLLPRSFNSSAPLQSTLYSYGQQATIYKEGEPMTCLPLYIRAYDTSTPYHAILGQLDGVAYCPGTFLAPESRIGENYIVFPNINRTLHYCWMAIKDE